MNRRNFFGSVGLLTTAIAIKPDLIIEETKPVIKQNKVKEPFNYLFKCPHCSNELLLQNIFYSKPGCKSIDIFWCAAFISPEQKEPFCRYETQIIVTDSQVLVEQRLHS